MGAELKLTSAEITFPESMWQFIEDAAAEGGFDSLSEYLQALVRKAGWDPAHARLEALLREGLDSGLGMLVTPENVDRWTADFLARHQGNGHRP